MNRDVFLTGILLALSGCGGGGGTNTNSGITPDISGGNVVTASGYFKDSNVSGLSYRSGQHTGVTGEDGSFTYEEGETVTFFLGDIVIGTAETDTVITPIDLSLDGHSSDPDVQNVVRFLIMLDSDGDPSNGITISPEIQAQAVHWAAVDFSAQDLAAELAAVMSDVTSITGKAAVLPDVGTAQNHLESTLRCAYAGAFKGSYTGDDQGKFGFLVDAATGNVSGIAYSTLWYEPFTLSGNEAISYDQVRAFASGSVSTGATFEGELTRANELNGTWTNPYNYYGALSGGFTGTRVGGAYNAVYRFTGTYNGDDMGLITFDVDADNKVTGVAYSVIGYEEYPLSGSVSGTTLLATAVDGTVVTGVLDMSDGSLSGAWSDASGGASGSFQGSGCKLN